MRLTPKKRKRNRPLQNIMGDLGSYDSISLSLFQSMFDSMSISFLPCYVLVVCLNHGLRQQVALQCVACCCEVDAVPFHIVATYPVEAGESAASCYVI